MSVAASKDLSLEESKRFEQAAANYRNAMSCDESRDQWIVDYLPLVKSIVNRLRFHFLRVMKLKICMELVFAR